MLNKKSVTKLVNLSIKEVIIIISNPMPWIWLNKIINPSFVPIFPGVMLIKLTKDDKKLYEILENNEKLSS